MVRRCTRRLVRWERSTLKAFTFAWFLFVAAMALLEVKSNQGGDVYLRGCPGLGTRWVAASLGCLFGNRSSLRVNSHDKHSGCSKSGSKADLLVPSCCWQDGCVQVVVVRHPGSFRA